MWQKSVQFKFLYRGGNTKESINVSQEAAKGYYLTFQVREVITGTEGRWDIEIQYKTVGGNLYNFPNDDEFDVLMDFNYEDAGDTVVQVKDAILDAYTASGWMDKIGEDWQVSNFGSVSSEYLGSPVVGFNEIHSTASPTVSVSMN